MPGQVLLLRIFLFFLFLIPVTVNGQWVLNGKVIDEQYGDPLPGASVSFLKTKGTGILTDVNGCFKLVVPKNLKDSLEVNFVGYKKAIVVIDESQTDTLVVKLVSSTVLLNDYIVTFKREDPAYDIIREALKRRKINNPFNLKAYEYESYSRVESYLSSADSSSINGMRIFKQMRTKARELNIMRDSLGNSMIPIVAAETYSNYYSSNNPQAEREDVVNKNVKGIGIDDVDAAGDLLTGKLNNYNFFNNYIRILSKDFSSPLGDGCILNYKYKLKADSDLVDGVWCTRIDIKPHNPAALAFTGTIWLSINDYAPVKLCLKTNNKTTINFIENLSVEQHLVKGESACFPVSTLSKAEVVDPQNLLPRIYVSYLTLNSNIVANKLYEPNFYNQLADTTISEFDLKRRELVARLSGPSMVPPAIFSQIEAMRNLGAVKQNVKLANVIGTLYYPVGQVDIGPITRLGLWNDVEGFRPGIALRSNQYFHANWQLAGSIAYGFTDKQFKYSSEVAYRYRNKRNSIWGASIQKDILPLSIVGENNSEWVNANAFMRELFITSTRWAAIAERLPFYQNQNKVWFETDLTDEFRQKLSFNNTSLKDVLLSPMRFNDLTYSEILLEISFMKTQKKIRMKNNRQINMGGMQFPRFTVWLAKGVKGLLGGQYNYQKVYANISQKNINVLGLGHSFFQINGGYIFSKVPFPLLRTHQGNESIMIFDRGFNQMKYAEFVSDQYVALNWNHSFDSPLCDRVPVFAQLSRYLGCRSTMYAGLVFGSLRNENKELLNQWQQERPLGLKSLTSNKPYIEVGASLDNIFRFLSVGYFKRLTYAYSGESNGGIKLAAKVSL